MRTKIKYMDANNSYLKKLRKNFNEKTNGCKIKLTQQYNNMPHQAKKTNIYRDGILIGCYPYAHGFNDGYCLVAEKSCHFFIDIFGDIVIDEQLIENKSQLQELISKFPKSVAKHITKQTFDKFGIEYTQELTNLAKLAETEMETIINDKKYENNEIEIKN